MEIVSTATVPYYCRDDFYLGGKNLKILLFPPPATADKVGGLDVNSKAKTTEFKTKAPCNFIKQLVALGKKFRGVSEVA